MARLLVIAQKGKVKRSSHVNIEDLFCVSCGHVTCGLAHMAPLVMFKFFNVIHLVLGRVVVSPTH